MGRRRAAGQRDRDAVAGEAGDHRRLVADPVAARLGRPRPPAIRHARHRVPRGRQRADPLRRAAALPPSARRSAPPARPPSARASTVRQRLAAPSSCSSRPGIAAVVEMQLDRPGQRPASVGGGKRGAQADRNRPAADLARRTAQLVLAGGEEQGVGRHLLAVVEPDAAPVERARRAAAQHRRAGLLGQLQQRRVEPAARQAGRGLRQIRSRPSRPPATSRSRWIGRAPSAAGSSPSRFSAASASQPRKPPQTTSRSPGRARSAPASRRPAPARSPPPSPPARRRRSAQPFDAQPEREAPHDPRAPSGSIPDCAIRRAPVGRPEAARDRKLAVLAHDPVRAASAGRAAGSRDRRRRGGGGR